MSKRPTVVLAHYDAEQLTRYRDELEAEGYRVLATSSGPDVLRRVEKDQPDAIILDALLPRLNGLSVLKRLKSAAATEGLPVLILVDDGDTYTENRALICGANAILRRSDEGGLSDRALSSKLRTVLGERQLTDARENSEGGDLERLLETASTNLRQENPVLAHITDALTGLFNAAYMELKLAEEFKRTRRFGLALTLVEIQLERDEEASDADPAWRQLLNEVAGILLCESRDIDILSRLDASTFRLLLPHTDAKGANTMVDRILAEIASRGAASDDHALRAAAGVAEFKGRGCESTEDLKARASEALALAWRSGGNCSKHWVAET
ncbi:MAG: response regulator [Planctomycetes bacterium]|nr:response regulator [Planctomycetota bacterium]